MNITTSYYLFVLFKDFGISFTFASFVPFLLSIGLTYGEVALVNAIYAGVVFAAELPTGMLADGKSRRWSMKAGVWFWLIGALIYFCANGFWIAALADAVLAIGAAFLSGARQAWITDALKRHGRSDELRDVFANESTYRGLAYVLGGSLGVLISLIDLRLIWVPGMLGSIASLVVVYRYLNGDGEPIERVTEKEAFKRSIILLRRNRSLLWVLGILVSFGGIMAFNHYWAPYFEEQVGRWVLSLLWPMIYGSCTFAGIFMRRVKTAVGQEGHYLWVSLFVTGLSIALVKFVPSFWIVVVLVAIHEFARGVFGVAHASFVQHRVESSYRATFGSLQSFISYSGLTIVPIIVWLVLTGKPNTADTIETLWFIAGGAMAVLGLLFYFLKPKETCATHVIECEKSKTPLN